MLAHAKNATFAATTDLRDAAWLEDHAAHQQRRLHPRRKEYRRDYPIKSSDGILGNGRRARHPTKSLQSGSVRLAKAVDGKGSSGACIEELPRSGGSSRLATGSSPWLKRWLKPLGAG